MLDFLMVSTRSTKRGVIEIYPKFKITKSSDLMIRGGDFYAIWNAETNLWSTDENDVVELIDRELDIFAEEYRRKSDSDVKVLHLWDAETGMIDSWHKYCQRQLRDNFHMLDEKLIFANTQTTKKDYASKKLPYALEAGETPAYERLISTLYSPEERHKIEWAIGAIVSGDSKSIQKFMVLYGAGGTGKSTVLKIIMKLFEGYHAVFDAKALGSSSNVFALEAFKTNPLVAIEQDGDLSKIEDNTKINSLVSHELMTVNEKFKGTYSNAFKAFLFLGTNKPVRITDAKSGIIRRLIDVSPSGNTLPQREYLTVINQINFELGAIANHCLQVYLDNPHAYDDYVPLSMFGATNDFYNFMLDSYFVFKKEDGTTLKAAWEMYRQYCEDARVPYPYSQRVFKEELKNYFKEYNERARLDDDSRVRSYYSGFRTDQFEKKKNSEKIEAVPTAGLIEFKEQPSIFDNYCADCVAQLASSEGQPYRSWSEVVTLLSEIDTSKLHYVRIPENHIVIDFDLKDETGNKSYERNLEAASKWPPTYAELSKSGCGIHLHYIYKGDPSELSSVYDEDIEVKVFKGKSSLRRMLTKCNSLPIATISSGLPKKKGDKKVVDFEAVKSEKGLRALITKNLNKECHPATKPSVEFIHKILNDAHDQGLKYDVSDMYNAVVAFGANSTHHAQYCLKLINDMPFKSEEQAGSGTAKNDVIIFYDVEVFPNLFLVNWKRQGAGNKVVRMINPTPSEIEELLRYKLVGFNCRRYDNHIMYARLMGYTNEELYKLSQRIINGDKKAFFGAAYKLSYTDVYDFASAGNKKSLKKFEIELGIHHQELGLPWDQPVPEELWVKVAEYCDNDVIATEAVFDHLSADWIARQILADLADMDVNDTTNSLTTQFIFGNNKTPQNQFNYRNLAEPVTEYDPDTLEFLEEFDILPMPFDDRSILPYFPGYKFEKGKSTYRGEDVTEGGQVYSEPGMYGDVALLDVTSMHPSSVIAEALFGPDFTARFMEIMRARVAIKHEDWDRVRTMLDGKLAPYVQKVIDGEMTSKDLANALKTAINSVYGLTSATFENAFKDPRNIDNIVAKRGALFMVDLKKAVEEQGFIVAHIKTDSIKIPDATPEIIKFVMDFGRRYGYNFEHEATYDRMCLVNKAVYIARYATAEKCERLYGYVPGDNQKKAWQWTATGDQFAVPYLFKRLFSGEQLELTDMCETMSVTSALYLDMNESLTDVSEYEKQLSKAESDYKKGKLSDTTFESTCSELVEKIKDGHDYHFIGKVGSFCPIKPGCGGGLLMREKDGKYYAATGTKGYRWLEAEMVRELGRAADIDRSYYETLVDAAIADISEYGDIEWFRSEEEYEQVPFKGGQPVYTETLPFV